MMRDSLIRIINELGQKIEALNQENHALKLNLIEAQQLNENQRQEIYILNLEVKNFKKKSNLFKIVDWDKQQTLNPDKLKALLDDCILEIDKCVEHLNKSKKISADER